MTKGRYEGVANTKGMVLGAVAMALASIVGVRLVSRAGALRGSVAVCGLWLVVAVAGYLTFLH